MALSANETYVKAKEAANNTTKFVNKINSILSNLKDFSNDLIMINNKIGESVIANDIISCSRDATNNLNKEIEKAITAAKKASTEAVSNCNSYITYLENDYNSNLEEGKDKIYLQRLKISVHSDTNSRVNNTNTVVINKSKTGSNSVNTLTSIANNNSVNTNVANENPNVKNESTSESVSSDTSVSNTNNDVKSTTETVVNNADNNSTNNVKSESGVNTNNPDEIDNYLNNIIVNLETSNINSNDIADWDEIINQFLINNNMRDKISSVTIENKTLIFHATNRTKYTFRGVKSLHSVLLSMKRYLK